MIQIYVNSTHTKVHTRAHKNIMLLSDLKPLFMKFSETLTVLKENNHENIILFAEKSDVLCDTLCDDVINKCSLTLDEYDRLKDTLEVLQFLLICECDTKSAIKEIKKILLSKIDMKTEMLFRRFKNKTHIGILNELPNDIIENILDNIY